MEQFITEARESWRNGTMVLMSDSIMKKYLKSIEDFWLSKLSQAYTLGLEEGLKIGFDDGKRDVMKRYYESGVFVKAIKNKDAILWIALEEVPKIFNVVDEEKFLLLTNPKIEE